MTISPVSLCVRLKFLFLEHFQPCHFYCLRFSLYCFRLNSTIRHETGTHVFWENGVDYPRVSPGAHPLAKKPEDSGYEIGDSLDDSLVLHCATFSADNITTSKMAAVLHASARRSNKGRFCRAEAFIRNNNAAKSPYSFLVCYQKTRK